MTTALTIVVALAALHWLARLGDLRRRARSPYTLFPGAAADAADSERELVSVLIPARDEELSIGCALRSVLAQTHAVMEIVVLDDASTDGTAAIVDAIAADDERVRRLSGAPLPPGWKGKCHALHQAASEARGEWLLLVDADVELHPSALATALAFAERQDSPMVSWFGTATTVTFWERVLQPMILDFITTHSDPRRVNDLTRPDAIANGQFILIRAALYRELGGHEAVRASIVEDMALARRAKAAGHRLRIAEAYGLMTTRMYSSFGTIWAGWAKNFYAGLHGRADAVIAALVYLALTGVLPHAALAVAGVLALLGVVHPWLVAVSAVAVAGQLAYRLAIARRATPPSLLSAVAHPLAASILALIVADSARRAVTGVPVSWKGRQYDTGGTSAAMPDDGGVDRDDGTGD